MNGLELQIVRLRNMEGSPDLVLTSGDPDPQMHLAPISGRFADLRVDRALLTVTLRSEGAAALAPVIYLDRGTGFEDPFQRLKPAGADRFAVEISSPASVRSIRLDPAEGACALKWIGATLAPAVGGKPMKLAGGPLGLLRALYRAAPVPLALKRRLARGIISARTQHRLAASGGGRIGRVGDLKTYREAYEARLNDQLGWRSPMFGAPRLTPVDWKRAEVRALSFYLPQFHPFAENDLWWGKGFTEWANVTKAVPQFLGHAQPKLPTDLGFYDLRHTEVMREQAELAQRHGVSGFCFHFYWFGGRRLMEQPLLNWLASDIDHPFALCWANENWTRRWDGAEDELLIGQSHSPTDDVAFIDYVSRYFSDPRYITVDGKPLLVVYRPSLLENSKLTADRWRERALALGFPGLHLVAANAFGFEDYAAAGFDALVEFPPHGIQSDEITGDQTLLNPEYNGAVFDYAAVALSAGETPPEGIVYPGVFPAWDNTARRKAAGNVFHGATPELFRFWLDRASKRAAVLPEEQRFVFTNAWNEWAEGAYLEPDRRVGHANLCAVADMVECRTPNDEHAAELAQTACDRFIKRSSTLVTLHVFYPELAVELATCLKGLGEVDIILTVPQVWPSETLAEVLASFPNAMVLRVSNRGRDIAPFLKSLIAAMELGGTPWSEGLKLHTKRSAHIAGGDAWRRTLLEGLVNEEARRRLRCEPDLGLLASAGMLRTLDGDAMVNNRDRVAGLARRMGKRIDYADRFPAGSMFWFKPQALAPLLSLKLDDEDFEPELGQIDGSTAHAIERLFGIAVRTAGYTVGEL